MGCSNSFEAAYQTAQFQEWMTQFQAMQLSKSEVRTLYYIFARVDFDKSGQIALAELLAHIDLERTRFTERIFSIFDADGSGEIDFREFVLSLWNYCTLTKATLGLFFLPFKNQPVPSCAHSFYLTEQICLPLTCTTRTGVENCLAKK